MEFVEKRLQHPQTFNFKQENELEFWCALLEEQNYIGGNSSPRDALLLALSLDRRWEWRPRAAVRALVFGQGLQAKFKEKILSLHILEETCLKTSDCISIKLNESMFLPQN